MASSRQPRPITVRYTQSITALVRIAGSQQVLVDSHGGRGLGSHLAVRADSVLVYAYDLRAVHTYTDAWIDGVLLAKNLPEQIEPQGATHNPGLVIRAHGADLVNHVYDPTRGALAIVVGQLTWLVYDQAAYRAMTEAWREAAEIAAVVFARR